MPSDKAMLPEITEVIEKVMTGKRTIEAVWVRVVTHFWPSSTNENLIRKDDKTKIIILSNTVLNSSYIEKTSEEVAVSMRSSNI